METKTSPKRFVESARHTDIANPRVLRVMRYPIDEARTRALQKAFGNNVEITKVENFYFGDNPAIELLELVQHFGDVVAVELVVPPEILANVFSKKEQFGNILFIKAEFIRGNTGRPTALGRSSSTGEDVLLFSRYVILEKVEYVTSPLLK